MIHLGSITEINGSMIEPVDCITGGSPCQDLSIAGKRAGLSGARSGLFMEQIRVVKEMRENDRRIGRTAQYIRPRFMVWENVAGAFSSNQGKDFQAVLTEIVKIAEPKAPDVPMPEKGRWPHAGELHDELGRWSIAWRLIDAQFWGVPQRRKRIALVADFASGRASDILFEQRLGDEPGPEIQSESESMSRDSEPSGTQRQETAGTVGESAPSTGGGAISFQERAGKPGGGKGILIQDERVRALSTLNNQSVYGISSFESNAMKSDNPNSGIYKADTARTLDSQGGSPACNQGGMAVVCFEPGIASRDGGHVYQDGNSGTLRANPGDNQMTVYDASRRHNYQPFGEVSETVQAAYGTGGNNTPMVVKGIDVYNGKITGNVTSPLTCNSNATSTQPIVLEGNGQRESHKGDGWKESETMYTLNTVEQHAVYDARGNGDGETVPTITGDHQNRVTDFTAITYGRDRSSFNQGKNAQFNFSIDEELSAPNIARGPNAVCSATVRRLTPTECSRLQGYPDGWCDIGDWTDTKGKKHKDADSPKYKALGNSIAIPFWFWLLRRISAQYTRRATLGSLFDGIGGFPLCWEMCNGKGTARWASEIEEFPIAVTKARFPENPDRGGAVL